MVGSYVINVKTGILPEKVATAVSALSDTLVGAEYTPIAYLGSQLVNGTNHAVLAEQLITSGKDTKNIVVLIFNEKGMECTLVGITPVLESGGDLGGINIDVEIDIPDDANNVFNDATDVFLGSKIEPFALLATQVTNGINYTFAAVVTPVTAHPIPKVSLVTINKNYGIIDITDILVGSSVFPVKMNAKIGLQAPWVTYAEKVMQLFKDDPDIKCDYDGAYELKLYVENDTKAEALMLLLPWEKTFGNVVFKTTVIPADEYEGCTLDSANYEELFNEAFDKNPAVSYIRTIELFMTPITYVVFSNEVVQFFNDDLSDINGLCSTLYEDIARDVFNGVNTVYFCTDTPQ